MRYSRFLLARFHMDSLLEEHTPKKIRKALAALPQGEKALRVTYDEAMKRIEGQNKNDEELAKRVIAFICYTRRPFIKAELQHALSVEDGDEDSLDDDSLIPENLLTTVCAGLVTVDEDVGNIRFVHYTTQEYFETIREEKFPKARLDMTKTCLNYLRLDSFDVEVPDGDEGVEYISSQYPFLGHASLFWGQYARESDSSDDDDLEEHIMDFFGHKRNFSCAARVLLLHPAGELHSKLTWYHHRGKGSFKALNLAAYFGLYRTVSKLLERSEDHDIDQSSYINSDDGFLGNALHWASIGDHENVLTRLLHFPETNRIINAIGADGGTSPLH